jgi:hypothetical protein
MTAQWASQCGGALQTANTNAIKSPKWKREAASCGIRHTLELVGSSSKQGPKIVDFAEAPSRLRPSASRKSRPLKGLVQKCGCSRKEFRKSSARADH